MATNNPTDVPVDALSRQCNNESIPPLLYSSEGIYIGALCLSITFYQCFIVGPWQQPQVSNACPPLRSQYDETAPHCMQPSSPFFPSDIISEIPVSHYISIVSMVHRPPIFSLTS